ncbi:unnamed protein product [Umbelopsis ramanniana]
MASSLVVPIAVWHNFPNLHTTCLISRWPHVFAGQNDGTIWVFSLSASDNGAFELSYKLLLLGHGTRVVAMCLATTETDSVSRTDDVLISASEDGQIIRWNAADGRCLAANSQGFFGIPRSLHVRSNVTNDEPHKFVFCCGFENEITIMDANTLKVVRVWGGHEDWVTCTMFHDSETNNIRLLTYVQDGNMAIWDFDKEKKVISKEHKYDNLSLAGLEGNIISLRNHPTQPDVFLAISTKTAIIFKLSKSEAVPHISLKTEGDSQFSNGGFIGESILYLNTMDGCVCTYEIKAPEGISAGNVVTSEGQLYYSAQLMDKYVVEDDASSLQLGSMACVIQVPHGKLSDNVLLQISFYNHSKQSAFLVRSIDMSVKNGSERALEAKECARATCDSIWPIPPTNKNHSFGNVIATINVNDKYFAIGFDSGTIVVLPLALALMHLASIDTLLQDKYVDKYQVIRHAHHGKVTSLYAPDEKVFGTSRLISGGQDGAVKIWNIEDGKLVATFTVHALPVKEFIEPAEQVGPRLRGCIVSIAMDNSAALISLEEMNCLYIIPGYPYSIKCIQWRNTEDYLIIAYQDDTALVWQMQTAHLDRKLTGSTATNVLADARWPISQVNNVLNDRPTTFKRMCTTFSVSSSNNRNARVPFIQVFAVNLRHLVSNMRSDAKNALQSSASNGTAGHFGFSEEDSHIADLVPDDTQSVDWNTAKDSVRAQLYATIVSALMSWGIDEKLENTCVDRLGLQRLGAEVTVGLRGVEGNFSFLIPSKDETTYWKTSPILTASRLMAVVTLVRSMLTVSGLEDLSIELMTHYTTLLPDRIGSGYCFPSFLFLSKYWQDTSARALFASALCQMKDDEKKAVIKYWERFLPTSSDIESVGQQVMARATIILAIIGSNNPEALAPETRKETALSLTLLLSDTEQDMGESKENTASHGAISQVVAARLTASMELLSEGFSTWEVYIKSSEVLRTLFMYAGDSQASSLQINRTARTAIFHIANSHMPLVIGTLTYDMMNAQKMEDRLACMKVINMFARKRPQLLFSSIPRVVEAVVKTLDPNVPNVRDSVIQPATSILHELVRTYPFVDFHSASQKLAVGTPEGASIIYDLRTATRCLVLEGHTASVIALAFSPDGKWIITCSLHDANVFIWHANPGIFGMLANSLSSVTGGGSKKNSERRPSAGSSQKPYKAFNFALTNPEQGKSFSY